MKQEPDPSHPLHFTRRERAGALTLGALCLLGWLLPELYDRWKPAVTTDFGPQEEPLAQWSPAGEAEAKDPAPEAALFFFDPNEASAEELDRLGLPPQVVRTVLRYRERGGRFWKPEDLGKIYHLSPADYERLFPFVRIRTRKPAAPHARSVAAPRLRPFDPNTASRDELRGLGLSERVTANLLRYREGGGTFRSPEELGKIYGMDPEELQRLLPYIRLAESAVAEEKPAPASDRPAAGLVIDVNRAGPEEWRRLPGIGPVLSERIVRFRDRLGGFHRLEQVAETYGLPDSTFALIRDRLRLSPLIRPLDVNRLTAEELSTHPYLNRRQAEALVAYREEHGPFRSAQDLRRIRGLPDELFEKLVPYIEAGF